MDVLNYKKDLFTTYSSDYFLTFKSQTFKKYASSLMYINWLSVCKLMDIMNENKFRENKFIFEYDNRT